MSQVIEVKVPDIGDFKDLPVIDVLVKAGDKIDAEQALITLESDKATMDVPSPAAGIIKALSLKVGDEVSEGSLILTLETANGSGAQASAAAAPDRRGRPDACGCRARRGEFAFGGSARAGICGQRGRARDRQDFVAAEIR